MGEFFGELFGAIAENFFNIVGKSEPDTMPELEYKSRFEVKFTAAQIFAKCILSIAIILVTVIGFAVTHHDGETWPLFIIIGVLGILTLLHAIYASLYKYTVDEEALVYCEAFKRKTYSWSDILCIRKVETTNQRSLTIAFYDKSGKMIFYCDTNMKNAWYLLKMSQVKCIEIREAKDLSLKQLMHL